MRRMIGMMSLFTAAVTIVCMTGCHASLDSGSYSYDQWTVRGPVFQAGPEGAFDDVAVKDPSIVFYKGRYHLFYTSKQKITDRKYRTALGYVSAQTLEGLNQARRYEMAEILGKEFIAPQVFYFEPHKLWYLVGHIKVTSGTDLAPVYSTNPDIENVYGWSAPELIRTGKTRDEFWIDFWVICDDTNAHFFYSNQKGAVLRMQCPIETFPAGLAEAAEEEAFVISGQDEKGYWRMFEAQHVYRVKKTNTYFMLAECAYRRGEGTNPYPLDSRKRFVIGLEADRLEGPWRRIEREENEYWAQSKSLRREDGGRCRYTQVSHPEIIRAGYNQRLEIEDLNAVQMIFQSFDASDTPPDYHYDRLPWELAIMKNK